MLLKNFVASLAALIGLEEVNGLDKSKELIGPIIVKNVMLISGKGLRRFLYKKSIAELGLSNIPPQSSPGSNRPFPLASNQALARSSMAIKFVQS